jgi:hypothetical protein
MGYMLIVIEIRSEYLTRILNLPNLIFNFNLIIYVENDYFYLIIKIAKFTTINKTIGFVLSSCQKR